MDLRSYMKSYCNNHKQYTSGCDACKLISKLYHQEWNRNHKEQRRNNLHNWYIVNRNPNGKWRTPAKSWTEYVYGLSAADLQGFIDRQGGTCAIPNCNRIKLHIDHDHQTKTVRGLLCRQHNITLGMCQDSPAQLRALADYLERSEI